MNYSSDRPIDNCEQDLLGRATFSKQLGKAILEYKYNDGLVIGLYGKWGTGKTSVINMAISELESLSEKDDNKPIIMRFAPWYFSDNNSLINIFFQNLKKVIDYQDNEEFKKTVGKALSDYSDAFDALSPIPVIGAGAAIMKSIAKAQGEKLKHGADLNKTRLKLEQALREINKKIVIVIDDIDRLTSPQIRDVFQLVRQVADFPNVIYILAMDRDIVRNALSKVHGFDGNEYLEKIIQVPFELPGLRKSKLQHILFTKLDNIIKEIPDKVVWDQQYWNSVFQNCIDPYINTLRDVNRMTNTFQFRYAALYQETSFEDMVALTTIEVLEPALYKWIGGNKEVVCGGFMHSFMAARGNKIDYKKHYTDEFSKLGVDPEKSIKCIATLFPVFAKDVNEYHTSYQNGTEIRGKMRAANEGRFELYFMFDLDDIKVSRSIINDCINDYDSETLESVIAAINKQGNIIYFLEEIRALVGDIPYNRLGLLASVMIRMQGSFQGEDARALLSISASTFADFCIQDLIRRLNTEDERYHIIRTAVEEMDKNGPGTVAQLINHIELSYGRLAGTDENPEGQIISLEHLYDIEQLFVDKVREIVATKSLLDVSELHLVVYLWESFDKDSVQEYLVNLLTDEFSKLRFVCAMAGRWNGTYGGGWSFSSKYYSSYVTDEEIYNIIIKYDKKELNRFSPEEQIKLASFVLNYKKDEMYHATEKKAAELVEEWLH